MKRSSRFYSMVIVALASAALGLVLCGCPVDLVHPAPSHPLPKPMDAGTSGSSAFSQGAPIPTAADASD